MSHLCIICAFSELASEKVQMMHNLFFILICQCEIQTTLDWLPYASPGFRTKSRQLFSQTKRFRGYYKPLLIFKKRKSKYEPGLSSEGFDSVCDTMAGEKRSITDLSF